jgi:hypothetical protein
MVIKMKKIKKEQIGATKKTKNYEKPSQEEYTKLLEDAHSLAQERNEKCTQRWVVITPAEADEILKNNNIRNRKHSTGTASSYASQITKGEWKANGEPVILSEPVIIDGVEKKIVMNGQLRLLACVMCGRPITTLLVDGVPFDVMETLDTGKVRTGKDVLSASQIYADEDFKDDEYVAASSIIKKVLEYCSGRFASHGHSATRPAPTNANIVVDGMEHADIYISVTRKMISLRKASDTIEYFHGKKPAMNLLGYYMGWLLRNFGYSEQEVFPFFEKLVSSKYQGETNDPIMSLRTVFKKVYDKNINPSDRENYSELVMYDFFARAWNSYVKGETRGKMNARGISDSDGCTVPLERDAVEAMRSSKREKVDLLKLATSPAL